MAGRHCGTQGLTLRRLSPVAAMFLLTMTTLCPAASELTPSSGRLLQSLPHPPRRLSIQTPEPELPNKNLPPECDQRRQRQHVPRHATTRRVETQLQDQCGITIRATAAGRAGA